MPNQELIAPLLDESKIKWETVVNDPVIVEGETVSTRLVQVVGTYEDITYNGVTRVVGVDYSEVSKAVAYLKAGITNWIVNALDERAMDTRVAWGDFYCTVDGDAEGQCIAHFSGKLDNDDDREVRTAMRNFPLELMDPKNADSRQEVRDRMKQMIWTEFRKAGWLDV